MARVLGLVKIIADSVQVPDIGATTLCDVVQIPMEAFSIGWYLFAFGLLHV